MTVSCEHCGKKFNAGETMVGKRVRCRGCGQVFTIPFVESPADDEVENPVAAHSGFDPSVLGQVESPGAYAGEPESDETLAPVRGRVSKPLIYPQNRIVDQWLPYLLLVISFGWTVFAMLHAEDAENVGWVPWLRIGIFWVIYAAVIWPIALAGSSASGRRVQVQNPPLHGWRVFATFSFPAVLSYILWSIVGTVGSFITGLIVGLAIALAVHFILYRLRPNEAQRALPVVAAWYIGSVVASVVAILALNFALQTILTAARTAHDYAFSPMGHYLPWNPPVPKDDITPPKKPVIVKKTPEAPVVTPPVIVMETPATRPVAPEVPPTVPAASGVPAPTVAVTPEETPATKPAETALTNVSTPVRPGANLFDDDPPDAIGKRPVTPDHPRVTDETPLDRTSASPVVETTREITDPGSFDEAILPLTPSRYMATVVHKGPEEDSIDVWNLSPIERKGTAAFRHDAGVDSGYMLSPDGKTIARIAMFPSLSVQVWSVSESRVVRSIALNKSFGTATALGFSDNVQVWVMRELAGEFGMESFDVLTGQRLKQVPLSGFVRGPANFTVSPDGKFAAMLRSPKPGAQGELNLINLKSGQTIKRFALSGLDKDLIVQPAGIAFSSDSGKVAIIIEHNDQGLLLAWNVVSNELKPVHEHLFPGGFVGDRSIRRLRTHAFDWLADGNGWLINGSGIYDSATGRLLGELGIDKVIAQRIVDNSALELLTVGSDPTVAARSLTGRMYSVKLKKGK